MPIHRAISVHNQLVQATSTDFLNHAVVCQRHLTHLHPFSLFCLKEIVMIASLDVFQLHSSDVGVRITCVDSLFEALKVIRKKGSGEYIVYSRKTGRRRFYKVDGGG